MKLLTTMSYSCAGAAGALVVIMTGLVKPEWWHVGAFFVLSLILDGIVHFCSSTPQLRQSNLTKEK